MALPDFPNNPTLNEQFTVGTNIYQWDGEKWKALSNADNSLRSQLADVDSTVSVGGVEAGKLSKKVRNIQEFGAHPSNTPEENDAAIQAAFDWLYLSGDKLLGVNGTYQVNRVGIGRDTSGGGGFDRNIEFDGAGMVLDCVDTANQTGFYASGKRLRIKNLQCNPAEPSHNVATLGFLWHSKFSGCYFKGPVVFKSGPVNFGSFWNTFISCDFEKGIYFDVTEWAINQNVFIGGRCSGITLSAFSSEPSSPKEAYNNVFEGVDITGEIQWVTDLGDNNGSPLVLDNCNYEGDHTHEGNIRRIGGASLPTNSVQSFWNGDVKNTFYSDYQFGNRYKGYFPRYGENLQVGGDASLLPDNIKADGLSVERSTDAVVGDSIFQWSPSVSSSFPRLSINVPEKYMEMARRVGWVTISFFINPVQGLSTIQYETDSTGGQTAGGVILPLLAGEFRYQSVTIPVKPADTFARVWVQAAGSGTTKDIKLDAVTMHLGDSAKPYSNSPEQREELSSFTKLASINGTAIDLFTFDFSGKTGAVEVEVSHQQASTGLSGYTKAIIAYSTGKSFGPSRVGISQVTQTSQGQGTLANVVISNVNNVVTVSVENVASTDLSNTPLNVHVKTNLSVTPV